MGLTALVLTCSISIWFVSTVAAQLEERSRQHARMTAPPAATGQLARSRPGQPAQPRLDRMGFTALVLPVSTSGSSLISFAGGISSSKLVNTLDLSAQSRLNSRYGADSATAALSLFLGSR